MANGFRASARNIMNTRGNGWPQKKGVRDYIQRPFSQLTTRICAHCHLLHYSQLLQTPLLTWIVRSYLTDLALPKVFLSGNKFFLVFVSLILTLNIRNYFHEEFWTLSILKFGMIVNSLTPSGRWNWNAFAFLLGTCRVIVTDGCMHINIDSYVNPVTAKLHGLVFRDGQECQL